MKVEHEKSWDCVCTIFIVLRTLWDLFLQGTLLGEDWFSYAPFAVKLAENLAILPINSVGGKSSNSFLQPVVTGKKIA